MTTAIFHPAIIQLLRLQSRGRRRRMWTRFCQTRRLILSAIACVLAVLWLGNAAMTIWFRETASSETLRALLSLGMILYAGWHFTKAAFFRPESPFDWMPVEREILLAMPLRPRDLVAYQLASVTVTTILKAGLFTLLLLPDLRCAPLGLAGLVLAMMTLEILRISIEIATWGMSRLAFQAYRATVLAVLMAAGVAIVTVLMRGEVLNERINVGEGLRQRLLDVLVQLNASVFSYFALPFQPFIDLILADALSAANVWMAAGALAMVSGLACAVIGLYAATAQCVVKRERGIYRANAASRDTKSTRNSVGPPLSAEYKRPLQRIPRWGGAGALAWRQLVGARRHWGSLLTAMIAPAVLAFVPCFVHADSHMAFLATTGALAFYTFLLLPTALRFDFRRDLDRLATLKGLPITPTAAAIGQTLAPVLIATLFQTGVLALASIARSVPLQHLMLALLVIIPLNVLVFALDNLIYLLYPYRMQQEGLEIFLRTMLTFTGKGLLFTAGLVALAGWVLAATTLTDGFSGWTGITINAAAVLIGGLIAGPSLLAALVLYGLCWAYRNMDPIEDVPR
jgi:hypothetical protein